MDSWLGQFGTLGQQPQGQRLVEGTGAVRGTGGHQHPYQPESRVLQDHDGRRGASGGGRGKSASLATLDLLGNNLGDSGAQALGAALAASSTLTSLNLSNCGITAAGAAHLAEGVGKSVSLATLHLRNNQILDSGTQALGAALAASSTLTSLYLRN